ncbi:hypothetical protein HCJ76_44270 [Streptomyces sp. MC1]|uniref:hypothetical protein n=1 Tax=Streptomyces sp. MC1 TaxID=295105 RepID=UPI0018C91722|nr:hypothetical protein [Streptomyces sp. MC1]MBG7704901.1 hypothetical protein [Streptomyces sp. MC1]
MSDISEHDEQFEVVIGRKAPLTMVPDWVTLFPGSKKSPMYRGKILSPQAKAVYNVLAMHVNVERGDSACWPSRETIADICGFSREQSVDPYLDQLDDADAIDREPITRPNGAMGVRYIVHQMPPPGYEGEQSVGEYHKRRREEKAQKQTRPPGRPRKTAAPATEPAPADTPAADVPEEQPAARKAPAKKAAPRKAAPAKKMAPAKKAAAKKAAPKEKTPEEIALDKRAREGADRWWKRAAEGVEKKIMRPLLGDKRQQSGYYLNLVTRIKEALAAGYSEEQIWAALHEVREWSPAKREFDRALGRAAGIQTPGRPNDRKPLFRNEQWQQAKPEQDKQEQGTPDLDALPSTAKPKRPRFGVDVQPV